MSTAKGLFQLHDEGAASVGMREVCWKGVCLKLNQSRNVSVTPGTIPYSLNRPKGCLWVVFPLKELQKSNEMQHFVIAYPRNLFLLCVCRFISL